MPQRVRSPVLNVVVLLIAMLVAIRSLGFVDTFAWRSLEEQRNSVTVTAIGVQSAQLGLRFFYDQRLQPAPNPAALNRIIQDIGIPGPQFTSERLRPKSLLDWLGFGLSRHVDTRAESFSNYLRVTVPLWLLAALLAIAPIRYALSERRRRQSSATPAKDGIDEPETTASTERGGTMRIGLVLALLGGVAIGAALVFFVVRQTSDKKTGANPDAAALASATSGPPIHPIVGVWRIKLDPIVATYTFGNDKTFTMTFKGVPTGRGPGEHLAKGTWNIDGNLLVMKNTSSSSGYSVVGEEESAKIVSVAADSLVLENTDRKGRRELLRLERVRPFMKGKFDNLSLLGQWNSEPFSLELEDSGRFMMISKPDSKRTFTHTGAWSQEGNQLRLMIENSKEQAVGRPDIERTLSEPAERVFEILTAADKRMLLLQPVKPQPGAHITFYRVN